MPLLCLKIKTGWCHGNDNEWGQHPLSWSWAERIHTSFAAGHKYRRFNTPYLTSCAFWGFKSFWAHQWRTNPGQPVKGQRAWRPWGFHWSREILSNVSCHRLQKEDTADTFALTPMMTLLWSIVKQAGEKGFRGVFLHYSFQAQYAL